MKKYFIMIVAMIAIASSSMAQDKTEQQRPVGKPDKEQMAVMQTERMAKQLELNEDQKAKLLELNKKYADMFQFMRPPHRNGGPRMGMRPGEMGQGRPQAPQGEKKMQDGDGKRRPNEEQMRNFHEKRQKYEEELSQFLTKEQMDKYNERHKNHRPHMRRNDN